MSSVVETANPPVRKSVKVATAVEHAFQVFTAGFDTWWPRSHSIGASPLRRAVIEGKVGGRCYQESVDGSECDWGRILIWEPPARLVVAWLLNPQWQPDPDISKASEVEISFSAEPDGSTRVDLEHRHFERHGAGAEMMRRGVDSPDGWGGLLHLFASMAGRSVPAALAPVSLIFKLNTGMFRATLDGVADEELWRRPTPLNNPMLWLAGHIVQTRATMLGLIGEPFDTGWGELFARGAALQEPSRYPSRAGIDAVHRRVIDRLKMRFAALTESDLAGPARGRQFPGATTLGDQLAFLAFHESYHIGQLAFVRKALGHSSIAG